MDKTTSRFALFLTISVLLVSSVRAAEPDGTGDGPPVGTGKFIMIDFENTAVGQIPQGFTKSGNAGVVDDVAHTGRKSLRMNPAEKGARRITLKGDIVAALGGEHWGRLYYKVKLPVPKPQGTGKFPVIHSTLVSATGISPLFNDPIEVRFLDTVLGPKGAFQYIYNVQPKKRPEFAKGTPLRLSLQRRMDAGRVARGLCHADLRAVHQRPAD